MMKKRLTRTKWAGALLVAVLLAALLAGCNEMVDFLGLKAAPEVPGEVEPSDEPPNSGGANSGGQDSGSANSGGASSEGQDSEGANSEDAEVQADDTPAPEPPADPTVFYVRSNGDDTADGSETTPFATLAHAYTQALTSTTVQTIVVLSDLDAGDRAMTLKPVVTSSSGSGLQLASAFNPGSKAITITSGNGLQTLKRTSGSNGSVVEVSGS
jgi:hypothetical protein